MSYSVRNLSLLIVMVTAATLAFAVKPTHKIVDEIGGINLEEIVPREFEGWKELEQQVGNIVNPQQEVALQRIYNQTLSRTYVNKSGQYIMLSIAYGEDQSDTKQLHLPDVCYPAQGFQVRESKRGEIKTNFGTIPVKRLFTVMGARNEPLTYWTTVGNQVVLGGYETKKVQLFYGFSGYIPDGLIFRVSNITNEKEEAYLLQEQFVNSLLNQLSKTTRERIAGLS